MTSAGKTSQLPHAYTLDSIFHALADPTRRAILQAAATEARSISEVAEPHPVSLAAVSKHVRVLEKAGLLRRHRQGRRHLLFCDADALHHAQRWLQEYRQILEQLPDA